MISNNKTANIILISLASLVVLAGVLLFFIPPALFPDAGMGFQVLRSMHLGGGFNNFVGPDQDDISQTYSEFLTWWSPGQYLIPYFFKLVTTLNQGQAIAITITLAQLSGLAGFYFFFRKIGFKPLVTALSLLFIVCQEAFAVPYVFYSGGEILIFSFGGWFLYGCASVNKPGKKLILFVLLSGWLGFFLKSSFIWMYAAGLCCLWIRLSNTGGWIKNAFGVGVPAALSLASIYVFFLSKGTSPASAAHGINFTAATFGFPIASPLLSDLSIDDTLHGLIFHTGKPLLSPGWSIALVILLAILSLIVVFIIVKKANDPGYRLFVTVFYIVAILFFGFSYLRQLNISYEARHFRLLGILIIPGGIYLISKLKTIYRVLFMVLVAAIGINSLNYVAKGFYINYGNARGPMGIAQPNIDQPSLNAVMKLDRENKNATFVFIGNDIGLEVLHNHIITLQPVTDDLQINIDDYRYKGFAGPLYIVLPESYNGPKEKMIMRSFPGYAGWDLSMLSDKYVLYSANRKR